MRSCQTYICDANFNKNYLTAKSPERARSWVSALLNINSNTAVTSTNKNNMSENNWLKISISFNLGLLQITLLTSCQPFSN